MAAPTIEDARQLLASLKDYLAAVESFRTINRGVDVLESAIHACEQGLQSGNSPDVLLAKLGLAVAVQQKLNRQVNEVLALLKAGAGDD